MRIYDDTVLGLRPTISIFTQIELGPSYVGHTYVQRLGTNCFAVVSTGNGSPYVGPVDCRELNCFYCEYVLSMLDNFFIQLIFIKIFFLNMQITSAVTTTTCEA